VGRARTRCVHSLAIRTADPVRQGLIRGLFSALDSGRENFGWQSLAFCVPACTLFLLVNLLYTGTGYASADPTERLCAALDSIAEFLRENAIATFLGLATLLISCRPAMPVAERKAFEVAMTAVLLATLSVVVACALVFQVLGQLALDELNLQLREHALQPRLVH